MADWFKLWLNDGWLLTVNVLIWSGVSNGVFQDSVLGHILFVIFINITEDRICGNIFKFTDDTKLFCKFGSDNNCAKLRADLSKLYQWVGGLANVV